MEPRWHRPVEAASLNLKPQRLKAKSLIPEPSPEPLNPKAYNPTLGHWPRTYNLHETSAGNASVLGQVLRFRVIWGCQAHGYFAGHRFKF